MKIVAISDTHGLHNHIVVPECDILIHAGDSCNIGSRTDLVKFLAWYSAQSSKYKILIAGNHCRCLDPKFDRQTRMDDTYRKMLFEMHSDIIYLENSETTIEGIKIWGSPITPDFYPENWAFNKPRGEEIDEVWKQIPFNTDIVVTHGPPYGIRDYVPSKHEHVGCKDLRFRIEQIQPKYHIFGHIHSGYGEEETWATKYVNAAICNDNYEPINEPIVIEWN